MACADTESTHTLLRRSDSTMLTHVHPSTLNVQLPNGACINSHSVGALYLPNLDQAIRAHIFEDSELSLSLLPISDLCNAGCTAIFTAERITIQYDGCIIVQNKKQ